MSNERRDLIRGTNLLIPIVREIERGEWAPSATLMLLHSLRLLIDQALSSPVEPKPDLFTDIRTHLRSEAGS